MKKINMYKIMLATAISSLTLVGCGSTSASKPAPKPVVNTYTAPRTPTYKSVSLTNIAEGVAPKKLQDGKDLREVVELAFAFSDAGDNKRAAQIFKQAVADFNSPDNALAQSLISAAICEYFKAGMINEVRENLKILDSYRTNIYDNFDDNKSIANIRKLVSR